MATIKPFRAIRPNTNVRHPLQSLNGEVGATLELDYLKHRLEPCRSGGMPRNTECKHFFQELLENKAYVSEDHPAIYIYERIVDGDFSTGIWALTSLGDLEKGIIARHEDTLAEKEDKLTEYRKEVALEGAPIVLTYRKSEEIKQLIKEVKSTHQGFSYLYQDTYHKFWPINTLDKIIAFKLAFEKLGQVYLADGHHRLASAAGLHKKSAQWISSLYYATDEIKIDAFHRLVRREANYFSPDLLGVLVKNFYISLIPNNKAFRPEIKGRFGMCLKGSWYQLDAKNNKTKMADAEFLQQNVLLPAFKIEDARIDPRLECFADGKDWRKLLLEIQKDPMCVVFTLCPMEVEELLSLSANGAILPPKSTYITPKSPFGLLMYYSGMLVEKGAKI